MNPEQDLAAESIRLAEHLLKVEHARVVDPLITKLRKAIAQRFKQQAAQYRAWGHLLPANHDGRFASVFSKVAADAYVGGSAMAAGQLFTASEAAVKVPIPNLPGYKRTAADVMDGIDETTEDAIAKIAKAGSEAGITAAAIVALVLKQFRDWAAASGDAVSRAETIAVTEISGAYHTGMSDTAKAAGRGGMQVEKSWDAEPDACEICMGNVADGWIPEDILFASGDSQPSAHPRCRCSLSYRKT